MPTSESARGRSKTQTSQETLHLTRFSRFLSKRSADAYLQESNGLQWPDIASVQLSGQLDRVLTKVTHYYGPQGQRYGTRRKKVADLMVGLEISKLFDLIPVTPASPLKVPRKIVHEKLPEIRNLRPSISRKLNDIS